MVTESIKYGRLITESDLYRGGGEVGGVLGIRTPPPFLGDPQTSYPPPLSNILHPPLGDIKVLKM